jgi:ParB-like chromosome segregation protein Spo0J
MLATEEIIKPVFVDPSRLREHAKQHVLFDEPSDETIEGISSNLRTIGRKTPIQACEDGTILSGQLIVKAAIRAGMRLLPVIIRKDLGDSNSPEVLLELVRQYKENNPVDEMTLGRCYRELRRVFMNGRQRLSHDSVSQIQLALRTEKSRETLEQLGRLAELPRNIQDLITTEKITKKQANGIRLLDNENREKILQALLANEPLKAVLSRLKIMQEQSSRKVRTNRDPFSDPNHNARLIEKANLDHDRFYSQLASQGEGKFERLPIVAMR